MILCLGMLSLAATSNLFGQTQPYVALFQPNGAANNIGHLEAGTYGLISGTNKWLGLGSAPAAAGPVSVYGNRIQWNDNFGIFNLREVNSTTRDLIVQWGGTTSNNRLRFEYSNSPTGAASTYMQIESDGRVGIGITPTIGDRLRVNGRLRYGSAEYVEDGGANTTSIFGNFLSTADGIYSLGSAANRWNTLFATNGTIQTSDRRDKENIKNLPYGMEELMAFRPVTYTWKEDAQRGLQLGLIAQEVREIVPEMVYDPSKDMVLDEEGNMVPAGKPGDRLGINYSLFIPILIKGVQDQQAQIEEQAQRIRDLEDQLADANFKQGSAQGSVQDLGSADLRLPALYQNNPNPFRESTEIRFYLPVDVQQAMLYVYDMQGQPVLEIPITDRGEAKQRIDGGMLNQGMYLYALIADGQEIDVKRMILTK